MIKQAISFIALLCLTVSGTFCYGQFDSSYVKEINQWHANRIKNLKTENGWLNLVGLHWLKQGINTFGSDSSNRIVFPQNSIAPKAGSFLLNGNTVILTPENGVSLLSNGQSITKSMIVYSDSMKRVPTIASGSLRWTIIKRGDKIGIRLRDLKSPLLNSFEGIDRFPVSADWKIKAILQAPQQNKNLFITNVIGQTEEQALAGKLVFEINHTVYTLDALQEGEELFIIFGDATSGKETYPTGRFLYAHQPGPDGVTVIDFNKAYNPPCAFTNYATCPIPPKQNILPIAITAGEKNFGNHTSH